MPHSLTLRKINHTILSSWRLQIKERLPPLAGLMDFQGKVQASLAGCVGNGKFSGEKRPHIWARQTLARLHLLLFSQLWGPLLV